MLGWRTRPRAGALDYDEWWVGERTVGGLRTLPERARALGAPPNWLGHVAVADVDASARRVAELGGVVLGPVREIPTLGRFALIRDPQGAVLSALAPTAAMAAVAHESPESRGVSWNELHTTDYRAAWAFYAALHGWRATGSVDMGTGLWEYFTFESAGAIRSAGAMSNSAREAQISTHWLYCVTVEDIEATLARVAAGGGEVINGPTEVPGGDLVAVCEDPQRAAFSLRSMRT